MSTWFPDRKVLAGGIAGLAAWGLTLAAAKFGIVLTPDMQTMIVAGIGAAASYITPPSVKDIVKRLDTQIVQIGINDPNIPVDLKELKPAPVAPPSAPKVGQLY